MPFKRGKQRRRTSSTLIVDILNDIRILGFKAREGVVWECGVADEGSKQVYLVENGAVETHTPFVL